MMEKLALSQCDQNWQINSEPNNAEVQENFS